MLQKLHLLARQQVFFCLFVLSLVAQPTQPVQPSAARKLLPSVGRNPERPGLDDEDLREQWELFWRGGKLRPTDLDRKARLAAQEIQRTTPFRRPPASGITPPTNDTWVNLGPFTNLTTNANSDVDSGRVTGILTHPSDPKILYLATSGGGLFKCTNADLTTDSDWVWEPISDSLPWATSSGTLAVGAIAMSPSDPNVIYLGMGDAFAAEGRGFFRSEDGGSTWAASSGLGAMTRTLCILPLDANVLLMGSNDGLKRSLDGGRSFAPINLGGRATGKLWSLVRFTATDLACSLETDGATNVGSIWHSHDGGLTWAPSALSGLEPIRISLATNAANSGANSQAGWGLGEVAGNVARGLLSTTDQGRTWTFLPAPEISGGLFQGIGADLAGYDGAQGFYNQGLAVDPSNINRIFVGSTACLYRTEDGGQNWAQLTHWYANRHVYAHADFHVTAWSQVGPKTLFIGNDGGLCIVRNPDLPTSAVPTSPAGGVGPTVPSDTTFIDNRRNFGLATHLVYRLGSTLATTPADSRNRITLGLQDNGSRVRQDDGAGLFTSGTFEDRIGADGFGTLIHPLNGNLMLGSIYNDFIFKSTDGGTTPFKQSTNGLLDVGGLSPFVTSLMPGPGDPSGNTVYTFSYPRVFKSTDFGDNWAALDMTGFDSTRVIRAVAGAATDAHSVAVATSGTQDAQVGTGTGFISNGGAWQPFGLLPNNDRYMSDIWFGSHDSKVIFVASVSPDLNRSHLWKSIDGGLHFRALDVANGFPFGIPVHVIRDDASNPQVLFAGTDFGVYRSLNGGDSWARYGLGLPMVAVKDLYVAPDGSFLRAATFGRGVWEIGSHTGAVEVGLGPTSATMATGGIRTFKASVLGTSDHGVVFTSDGGNLQPSGSRTVTFHAPPTPGLFQLRAASITDLSRFASASITVKTKDLNLDGTVDVLDLALMATAYRGSDAPSPDLRADFDGNGTVDDADITAFLDGA